MGCNINVDLLGVEAETKRLRLVQKISRDLHGALGAVNVICGPPENVTKYRDNPTLLIAFVVGGGKVVSELQTKNDGQCNCTNQEAFHRLKI